MQRWVREIIELHEFFEALFLGRIHSLDRAERALASDFTMAGPTGAVTNRDETLAQLATGRGHTNSLTIPIDEPHLLVETDDLIVAAYLETHELSESRSNERRTTVIFRKDPDGPNGLRWLRAHETFIDPT